MRDAQHPTPLAHPVGAIRPGALRMLLAALLSLVLVTTMLFQGSAPAHAADDPCGPNGNPVACENTKPGTSAAVWDIDGAGDPSIQGFATDISVNVGQRIDFKIATNASSYGIRIFRTGWYQGLGARLIDTITPSATLPQIQPQCITDLATELYDCGNWAVSGSWQVPANAVSGVYIALLRRNDTGGESHIIFVVRDDARPADVLFQTSDTTWQAYNSYGGSSFYTGGANGRAYKLSYNRPFNTREGTTKRDFYFSSEYAQVRFLERNGYDVTYASGIDSDRYGANLLKHGVFLSVGHDEYWSGAQRANVEAARDAGVHMQFLTGNEVYWRTRWEPAASTDRTPRRTLVSYKETWGNAKIDPSSEWTGTWRDPRFASQANGGGLPENALSGTMYRINHSDLAVTVSSAEGRYRMWRNTSLATLPAGQRVALAPHTVGYESNEVVDNGHNPPGLIRLSTTTGTVPEVLQDYGNTVQSGSTTHNTTLYRAASGALVFSAGSVQWAWGLDQTHDGNGAPADPRMQQAQVNLLADMGAQPVTLMAGLVPAQPSTDATAPTVTVTSPTGGTTVANGALVTVAGTASDIGGVVAGVEVSTDGGATWHAASGTTQWTYSYNQRGMGAQTVQVRAIDDSANYPATPVTVPLTVTGPYSVFGDQQPAVIDSGDTSAVELGLRFTTQVDGFISGVRFHKAATNGGTHTGSLWDAAGNRLATVTFAGETASGWQTARFATPVAVAKNTTYVVSYTAPQGHYSAQSYYWPYSATASPPFAIASGFGTQPAGVYGIAGTFPGLSYRFGNYFVDAVFDTVANVPLTAIAQWPVPGATDVPTGTSISARFSTDVAPSTVTMTVADQLGAQIAGSVSYDPATRTVLFSPSAALPAATTFTVTLGATTPTGGALTTGGSWSFTTASPTGEAVCPCTLFPNSTVPTILEVADNGPVTLGVRFTPTTTGAIAGIRFYKGAGNTGTHVGSLWSVGGQQLASATFVNESASGWQTVYFSQAVPVQAGTQYIAAYRTTVGAYSATLGAFAGDGFTRGPLRVGNTAGSFTYTAGFPGSTSTTNYYVDVVFVTDSAAPLPVTVSSASPAAGQTNVTPSTTVSAVLSGDPATPPTIALSGPAGAVAGTVTWDAAARRVGFTPSAALAWSTSYQATVTIGGTIPTGGLWSFTTSAPPTWSGQYSLLTGQTPVTPAVADDQVPVELGMSFGVSQAGSVTAIRFYKGTGNGGTHTGSLWTAGGTRLATVTFANETATGWQTAVLQTPVALTPGERYVVSYYAPQGRYAVTANYFSTLRTNGPITADTVVNGRYRYGTGGGFPQSSWNASNYFVDIVFDTGTTPPPPAPVTVTSTNPATGATGVVTTTTVSATLSASPAEVPTLALSTATGAVAGSSAWNATSRTITFTPAAPLAASTSHNAAVSIGGAVVPNGSWSFTTAAAPAPSGTFTLHGNATPQVANAGDTSAVELGTAFTVTQPGSVTGIRFYKATGNSGTHVGTLWNASGTALSRVTFTNESATGWQTATLANPVALTPGQRYVVSYLAPNGGYSTTVGYFSTQRVSGPIVADTVQNGRYRYGASGGFPTGTWNAAAYFVDVVFATGDAPPPPAPVTVSSTSPTAGATGVATTTTISATLTGSPTGTPSLAVTGPSGAVAGSSAWNATTSTVTFTPAAPLAYSTVHQGAVSIGGAAVAGGSWSFTTAAAPSGATPVTLTSSTPTSGAVGVATSTTISATLSGVSSGTPTLSLTSPSGAVAGTSAWNATSSTVTFTPSAPLAYSTVHQAAVLIGGTAVAGASWSFTTAAAPPPTPVTLTSSTPTNGAVDVAPTATISATLAGVGSRAPALALTGPAGAVAGTSAWNAATSIVTFTPAAPLEWATAFQAAVSIDGAALAGAAWSFTTAAAPPVLDVVSLFSADSVPQYPAWDDPASVQVAVRFTAAVTGAITGIRFYKGDTNTGTHTGTLWNANGSRLAEVLFVGETGSGWQTALFSTPVTIQAGTEYRAGLHSTTGRYAITLNGLTDPVVSGPLSTPASGGAFTYGTEYPGTITAHNFWIDVLFDPTG